MIYPDAMTAGPLVAPPRPKDHAVPALSHVRPLHGPRAWPVDASVAPTPHDPREHVVGNLGALANARPPSPYIGARTIVAMQWVVFGACLARWLVA